MSKETKIIAMLLVLALVASASAKAITVDDDGPADFNNIQAAIDSAFDGDTVIVADGVYTGPGNRDIDFYGLAITVRSENGPENCIIDCNGTWRDEHRGFYFHSYEGQDSIVEGFTITNGYAFYGGGIRCSVSSPTISNCIITGNSAEGGGGGIYCWHSNPTISNCTISGNKADWFGNGGGGIYCYLGAPTISNCTISGNSTYEDGGGIYCSESRPTISNCIITGNSAGGDGYGSGGGIYIICAYSNTTITNCTITGNSAYEDGGGIACTESSPTISNCTISGNSARNYGGGIYGYYYSRFVITNCTITGNSAADYGGGVDSRYNSSPTITNCILWDNSPQQITGGASVTYSDVQGGWPGQANIDADPCFAFPNDYHLMSQSPCINAGNPYFLTGLGMDIDGQPRIMGFRIDMGADEFEKFIVVTIPNGGELWASGSIHEIEWSSYGAGAVNILFSIDAGGNWQSIESSVPDTGVYTWHLPNRVSSDRCLVSVVPGVPDPDVICIESGPFEIQRYQGPQGKPQAGKHPREKYGPEFGCVKWQFQTEGPVTAGVTLGRNIGRNTKAYIACEDGKLYTLDANSGSLLWSYDTNSPLLGSPAVNHYGTVYLAGSDGRLYAIDKKGRLLWMHTTKEPIYSSPVVSTDGRIYVCSLDGTLYTLARDGSELWSFETKGAGAVPTGSIFATPPIGTDGTVYVAGLYDPNLYALNPHDGGVKWNCNFAPPIDPCNDNSDTKSGWPFASPAIAADGTIYQTLVYDSNLYAIEPDTGAIIWLTNLADPCSGWFEPNDHKLLQYSDGWSKPVLAPDGTIYISFDDPYLRAVDPDGGIKWVTKLGTMGGFTLTVGSDGLIYAASDDNHLYVVNPDGEEIARFQSDDWLSHPVIAPGHTIIVSDANNMVWAITQEDCEGETLVLDAPEEPEPNEPLSNQPLSKGKNKK